MGFPIICLNKEACFIRKSDKKAVFYRRNKLYLSIFTSAKQQEKVHIYKQYFSYREIL